MITHHSLARLLIPSWHRVAILAGLVLAVDAMTPRGITVWAFYPVIILYASRLPQRRAVVWTAGLCAVLVPIGAVLAQPSPVPLLYASLNRTMGVAVIWLAALLISQRRAAEDNRRKSEERFEKAFRSSPHPIGITELESGICLEVNEACLALFGFRREDVIGTSTLDLQIWPSPADRARFVQLLRAQGAIHNIEMTLRTKGGEARQFLCSSELIDLKGTICAVTVGNDITERKRAEEALRQAHDELETRVEERTIQLVKANTALRQAYDQLRDVTRQLEQAEEAERRRIARELHDEFGQALTGLKFEVAWLNKKLGQPPTPASVKTMRDKTEAMIDSVDALLRSVRETAASLRPSILDDLGLFPALEWLAQEFRTRTDVRCDLEIDQRLAQMPLAPDAATALFRIIQELLTNVMRHAQASTVRMTLREEAAAIVLELADNGRGITQSQMENGRSIGLRGMQERVSLLGGALTIAGSPGIGTTARIRLPLDHVLSRSVEPVR